MRHVAAIKLKITLKSNEISLNQMLVKHLW